MATGFFGKLPTSGDFVARGLGPGLRPFLDRWLTSMVARFASQREAWPDGGIRGTLDGPAGPVLILIIASSDAAGREFPIVACTALNRADRSAADRWADLVAPELALAARGGHDAASLLVALEALRPPEPGKSVLPTPLIWAGKVQGPPQETLRTIFVNQF